jgi:hypothetical protein
MLMTLMKVILLMKSDQFILASIIVNPIALEQVMLLLCICHRIGVLLATAVNNNHPVLI